MRTHSRWVKVISGGLVFLSVWTFGGGTAYAAALHDRAESLRTLHELEKRQAQQAAEAEKRRKTAVAEMQKRHAPDPKKLAKLQSEKERIASLHPQGKLAALSAQLELASKLKPGAPQLEHTHKLVAEVLKDKHLQKPGDPLAQKLRGAKHILESAKRGHNVGLEGLASKKPAHAEASAPRRTLGTFKRQEPRHLPEGMHGALAPDLRELYAQAGQGAWIESGGVTLPASVLALSGEAELPGPLLASNDLAIPLLGNLELGALNPPASDDLAETPEVKLTPQIQGLAQSLGHDPLRIFNYVHDQFESELYYGSKKGAVGALVERGGNDFDLSSLLIALYRASGVPARYEYGSVTLSPQQVLDLTGASDVRAGSDALSTVGVPASLLTDAAGQIKAVEMERVWVRAFVPYGDLRGTDPTARKIWVRLDPGLKRYVPDHHKSGRGLATFDPNAYLASLNPNTPAEIFQGQLLTAAKAQNVCDTLDALMPVRRPVVENFTILPVEHPAQRVNSYMVFSRVPDNMRFGVSFELDDAAYATSLPELYGSTVSLRYVGHSAADQQAIAAAGSIANLSQPYNVNIDPSLRINGTEVSRFPSHMPGDSLSFTVRINVPQLGALPLVHPLTAGGVYALGISPGRIPTSVADDRAHDVQLAVASGAPADDIDEARAQEAVALYASQVEGEITKLFGLQEYGALKDVTEAVAGRPLYANYSFGLPVSLSRGKYQLDVARESLTPFGLDGDHKLVSALNILAGYQGSTREHLIWEQVLHSPALSSIKVLQAASAQSVPVLNLTSASQVSQLSGYSSDTIAEVQNDLGQGKQITIPKRPISYQSFEPAEAFIALDPTLGVGDYRLGTLGQSKELLINGGEGGDEGPASGAGGGCPACSATGGPGGSYIRYSDGDHEISDVDLTLPSVGIPLVFQRAYSSRSNRVTALGYGWMHSYGMFLEPNGSGFTYVSEDLHEVPFTPSGTNTWASAPQWHETLSKDATGYNLRFKDGLVYRFDLNGKLVSETDNNQNTVSVTYDVNGRLARVTGSGGSQLSFAYDGQGNLSQVSDSAGRSVTYGHTGLDLTLVTDVLGKSESYSYSADHNLTGHVDKNGHASTELYDESDRWIGSIDPLGNSYSVVYDDLHQKAAVTDKNGNTTLYEWNGNGNPVAITDALGNRNATEWDGSMNVLSRTDGTGAKWTYSQYDANGNAHQVTDPLNQTSQYSYELTHNRVLWSAPAGQGTTYYEYDSAGNLKKVTNPNSEVTTYAYYPNGLPQSVTQVGNAQKNTPDAVTQLAFDSQGNLQTITDPENGTTSLGYDSAGHLTSMLDAVGNSRSMQVDARGQVQSMTDGESHTTQFRYDDAGNRTQVTDPEQHVTKYAYDALNRVTAVTDAQGHVSKTEYDPMGHVVARVDGNGNRTELRYDALGRLVETHFPDGSVTSMAYCAERTSQPCESVDAAGNVTIVSEDKLGRPSQTTDAMGHLTSQAYDVAGRVQTSTDANGNQTYFGYDPVGRVQSQMLPASDSIAYTYDPRGNRLTVTKNYSQTTTFSYDRANRLKSETTPPAFNNIPIVTAYTYDGAGNRKTKLDGNGILTTYNYDHNRRLRQVLFQDGTHYNFDYDARGNRTLEKNATHERQLAYDELNRVIRAYDVTLGKEITYGYDANGNRTKMTVDGATYTYAYDSMNRLVQVTEPDGDVTRLLYDLNGNRQSLIFGNGMVATYSYDADNRLTKIIYTSPSGQVLQSFTYDLDAAGNRLSKKFADGTAELYGYDKDNRLTSVQKSDGSATTYSINGFDQITNVVKQYASSSNGNVSTTNTVNTFNQVVRQVVQPYSGQGTDTSYTYDGNGNMAVAQPASPGAPTVYSYDQDNRLRQASMPGGITDTFEYDANGLRTKKVDSTGTTNYLLDGLSVAVEYDGVMAPLALHNNNPQRVDEQFNTIYGTTKTWIVADAQGSIYAFIDKTGTPTDTFSYEPFGTRNPTRGSPDKQWGYTGREHDIDTGLNYHRDRYLAPHLATWTQPDRLAELAGNTHTSFRSLTNASSEPFTNIYQYAGNPASATDPLGEFLFYFGQSISPSAYLLPGGIASYGEVIGLSEEEVGAASALTIGFTINLGTLYSIGVSMDVAIFPDLNTIDDYKGWFIQGSLGVGFEGSALGATMGLIWSLDADKLSALHPLNKLTFQDVSTAMSSPVGYAFSASGGPGISFITAAGYSISASIAVTYSWVLDPRTQSCNRPWGGGLPPGLSN